jgi:hypothetical protein
VFSLHLPGAARLGALLAISAAVLSGCVVAADDDADSQESDLTAYEKYGGPSPKWIYRGMLPKLEKPRIVVSLNAHTARVTGLLPASFNAPLPFYANAAQRADGRTELTVVYPIATGKVDPTTGKAPAGPGNYARMFAAPFVATNEKATWGGFPFMTYSPVRGLAFHGPISAAWDAQLGKWTWRLLRGPVSHGCNRMQGEHVVELAHLLGIDMTKPHAAGESLTLETPVTIAAAFDSFGGKLVDVDYPVQPGVKRPSGNVMMFRTWDSRDFPRWVCAYDKKRTLDAHHCDAAGVNRLDPLTGK